MQQVATPRRYGMIRLSFDFLRSVCLSVRSSSPDRPRYQLQPGKRWKATRQPFARFPSLMGMRLRPQNSFTVQTAEKSMS